VSFIIRSLIKVLILFAVIAAMLEFMDLSITLDGARHTLSKKLTSYTGREIHIDGDIQLSLSYSPQLLVKRIHIKNSGDFGDEDFITISEVHIEIQLLPLLHGQIQLNDISADQAKIHLHQKADGSNNWSLTKTAETHEITETPSPDSDDESFNIERISLSKIELTNVDVLYRDDSRQQILNNSFDQLLIDISDEKKPLAEINGSIEGHPYAITFEAKSLEPHAAGEPWILQGTGHIADRQTNIHADILYKEKEFILDLDFDVKNVDLGMLLDELEIITGQKASTGTISIKAKLHGKDLAELYEQAEISLQLGEGYWDLQQAGVDKNKKLIFSQASSFTSWNKPVEFSMDGKIEDIPVTINLKSNRLKEYFDDVDKMDLDLASSIAGTEITLKGTLDLPIKSRMFKLDITIQGKDLERLNPIIDTEFPPLNDFSLTGKLIANNKGYILKSSNASIGSSQLQASIVVEMNLPKPLWTVNINSRQLQLNDFEFDDWNTQQDATTSLKTSAQTSKERPLLKILRDLEDTVKSPEMHLNLNLKADKVLSGEDHLGKAQFQLQMHDNIFSIQNADIELPGGRIKSSISLKLDDGEASGHVILNIDKLDYGITTRLFEPDSKIDGTISTRVDLELGGSDFTRLLDQANGIIDIAVWPKNTRPTKALNLWTTNLYLILLPELKKKESLVNCMVGLMNIEDGTMREEFFALDTTKLWIYGNINADFKQEYIKLSLFPQSKTARLFSFQSPIRIEGRFSDIQMAINPVDLTGSYISFITSPLHVPARWIFSDKVPEDGSAVCEQLFDREYVEKLNAEVKIKDKKEIEEILESY
jgi:uncharacterized protein involved in outer membrane biogenesis